MGKIYRFIGLVLALIVLLAGCTNQNQQVEKENSELRLELQTLKAQLAEADKKINEQEELYSLRNQLDNQLHLILRTLIREDYESAKQYFASTVKLANRKLVFKTESKEFEFIIPDRQMVLRQRAYMIQGNSYGAIYEIYDAGYSDDKYKDRINSLNVGFVKEDDQWKLSNLFIDE